MKNGLEANDTVWFWHVRHSIPWWSLTPPVMKLPAFFGEKSVSQVRRIAAKEKQVMTAGGRIVSPVTGQVRHEKQIYGISHPSVRERGCALRSISLYRATTSCLS
jgi:hypothetical protein